MTNYTTITDEIGTYKRKELTEDVTLFVYESGHAALEISDNTAIEFVYSEEVADLFTRFDEVKAVELFEVLRRNSDEA